MKTFIFCTSYINDNVREYHHNRYRRWIDHHVSRMDALGAEHLFLMDDGSDEVELGDQVAVISPQLPDQLTGRVSVVRFPNRLGRPTHDDYQGWWRSFSFSWAVAHKYGFEKIIHVESDFFVLGEPLLAFMKSRRSGWTGLFSHFYDFPESAVQVICQDAFGDLKQMYDQLLLSNYYYPKIAELAMPFTHVSRDFRGDRFGQLWKVRDGLTKIKELQAYTAEQVAAYYALLFQHMDRLMAENYFEQSLDYVGQVPPDVAIPTAAELVTMYKDIVAAYPNVLALHASAH